MEYIDINIIKNAEYNPRIISEEKKNELLQSIQKIGFVVPVIINKRNNTLIAGHQRTETAKKIGINKLPVFYTDNISINDEIRFNQFHNGTELKDNNLVRLDKKYITKYEDFVQIDNKYFDVDISKINATFVKEICYLILRYGNVFSSVFCNEKSYFGNEYIYACQKLSIPVNCYICNDDKEKYCEIYFNKKYGEFCYDKFERKTYVQSLAQLHRETELSSTRIKQNKSTLYEELIFPYLQNNNIKSILDFGCGRGEYIKSLKNKYNAYGLEFYPISEGCVNYKYANIMINQLIDFLKNNNSFDIVICDSVLNSINSIKAEKSVMTCLNLFAINKVFISGRAYDEDMFNRNINTNNKLREVSFFDKNKFTANYRKGNWYYQKYHSEEDIQKIANDNGFKIDKLFFEKGKTFQVELSKIKQLSKEDYINAIDFEFNLELPNNTTYNRQDDIKKVLKLL